MKNLLKKFVTIILAFVVFIGTFFIESATEIEAVTVFDVPVFAVSDEAGVSVIRDEEVTQISTSSRDIEVGDTVQTNGGQIASIHFDDIGEIRLDASTSFTFVNETADGYVFELNQGQVWVNNKLMSSALNVKAGASVLMPGRSAFNVVVDGNNTKLKVFSGHVTVGLVKSDYEADSVIRFQNGNLINSFLVAEGGQATIPLQKVDENVQTFSRLLYSKLIKEFGYSLMDVSLELQNPWISKNIDADKSYIDEVAMKRVSQISSRGLSYSSLDSFGYNFDRTLNDVFDFLTFTDEKKIERLVKNINAHLLDAEYLLTFGRDSEANSRLILYKQMIIEEINKRDEDFKIMVISQFRKKYADLYFALPDDPLYNAKTVLSDLLISQLGHSQEDVAEKLMLIRDYMNYAFALTETDQVLARLSVQQYSKRFTSFVESEKNQIGAVSYLLAEENQIMDNLLKVYPQFYQDSFFAMKRFLEDEWLKLIPEGDAKNEERQTIISTKIDFLQRVKQFFLDEKVVLGDARDIVNRLIVEINDLQPATDIGVSSLFALRLKDYGTFLKFLNTTDVSILRGASSKEKYEDYINLQQEYVSIEEVVEELFGEEEEIPVISVEQITDQIVADFESIGVTNLRLSNMEDINQDIVKVESAKLNGVVFSGDYEWSRKLLSNIQSEGEVVSETAVRIAALEALFPPPEEEEVVEEVVKPLPAPELESEEVSQAARVAKILLIRKLVKFDIDAKELDITVSNLEEGIFGLREVSLISDPKITVSFTFSNKNNEVSDLIVNTPGGLKKSEKTYDIESLSEIAVSVFSKEAEAVES
jgi:hypothetical protein